MIADKSSRSDLTWKGYPILSSVEIDNLLAACEEKEHANGDETESLNLPFTVWRPGKETVQTVPPLPLLKLSLTGSTSPLPKYTDARLFNHYITHVASMMMPFEDARNPWKTLYPAFAVQQQSFEQKAMIKAMISQAAFNLSYLGCDTERMLRLGSMYYQASIQELRNCAGKPASSGDFIATVLTLMMAEVRTRMVR